MVRWSILSESLSCALQITSREGAMRLATNPSLRSRMSGLWPPS